MKTTIQSTANKVRFPDGQYKKPLNIPGLTYFRLLYSPNPLPSMMGSSILEEPSHPLYLATRKRYMERDKNTLWWNVYTPNNIAQKRVVRSWCNRRLRNAFKEALAARGFDKEGRSIEWPGIQNLRGSVDMQSSKELITAKYDDLKHQAGLSVEAIFRIQSKGPALEKAGGPRVTQRYHERGSMGASM